MTSSDCCAICLFDNSVTPYITTKITDCNCKFHADCINHNLYAPIFRYRHGEEMPKKLQKYTCNQSNCRSLNWHDLKPGPFIWRRSDGTIKAEGSLIRLSFEEGKQLNGYIIVNSSWQADFAYVLDSLYKEYDEHGILIRSMNYKKGEVIGTFKTHSDIQMEQQLVSGGKVHGLRTIILEDGTQITENWRYGVMHGPRIIRYSDGTTLHEEYENGYMVGQDMPHYGPYYDFYPTGQLREEGFMIDGIIDYSKKYDKNGILRYYKQYIDNNIYKYISYYPSGHIHGEGITKKNINHGPNIEYRENGSKNHMRHYYSGWPFGEWIYYNTEDKVINKERRKGSIKHRLIYWFTFGRYPRFNDQIRL